MLVFALWEKNREEKSFWWLKLGPVSEWLFFSIIPRGSAVTPNKLLFFLVKLNMKPLQANKAVVFLISRVPGVLYHACEAKRLSVLHAFLSNFIYVEKSAGVIFVGSIKKVRKSDHPFHFLFRKTCDNYSVECPYN